jgi:hypothetical protein
LYMRVYIYEKPVAGGKYRYKDLYFVSFVLRVMVSLRRNIILITILTISRMLHSAH